MTAGWLGEEPKKEIPKFVVEDDRVHTIHNVVVHEFRVSDAEDPDLYAAGPLFEWQKTEKGEWVMGHAVESPLWHRVIDVDTFGWKYQVVARIKGADYTFYQLKWGSK